MDGGVAIPNMPPQGFFQMPRPQVRNTKLMTEA